MRLTVLGSGTLLPDDDRRSAAHLVEVGDVRLLLDCGSGTVHGFDRHGVPWRRITHLALSHFHTDHVGDVAPLLFALKHGVRPARTQPLTILGPPGLRDFLDPLAEAFGDHVREPGFPLEIVELPRSGRWTDPAGRVEIRTGPTRHTDASVAYRIAVPSGSSGAGPVLGYTGDTGPDRGVAAFLAGVDLLLSECSLPDPPELDTHLTPAGVAELARAAQPGLLVLTHLYPPLDPARVPEQVRAGGYSGEVRVARDGERFDLTGGPRET